LGAAVVAGNTEVSQAICNALLGALGASAASQGTMNNLLLGNERFQYYETICGGSGAGPSFDGASAVHTHMTNTRITDPEILELRPPLRVETFGYRARSGGEGQHRGGDGAVNGDKTRLENDYQFAEKEEFKFGVNSSTEGFLYIVSRNTDEKAVLAYPNSSQTDNVIKKDTEGVFPKTNAFWFDQDTPPEARIYFIIVPSREDALAKRLRKVLDTEKSLSDKEVSGLFTELDKLANDSEKSDRNSENQIIVQITKLRKKT
jgi:hypothetical protein